MAENKTIQSILGDTALDIGTYAVNQANKFAESDLGQALYYGPAIAMGARIGGAVEKTVAPLTDMIKQRMQARKAWNENIITPDGTPIKEQYSSFREFFKTEIRDRAASDVMNTKRGDKLKPTLDDQYDGTIVDQLLTAQQLDENPELGSRSGKTLVDRNKLRAYYLNAITDYKYDPKIKQTVQLTPRTPLTQLPNVRGPEIGPTYIGDPSILALQAQPPVSEPGNSGFFNNLVSGIKSINDIGQRFNDQSLQENLNMLKLAMEQYTNKNNYPFLQQGTQQNKMYQNSAFGKSFNPNTGKYE